MTLLRLQRQVYFVYRCAEIVNLPLGCSQVKNAGDCCPQIQCTGTTGTFTGSQTVGGTIGGVPSPQISPNGTSVTGTGGQTITGQLSEQRLYTE